jgi:hypothetical protein
MYRRTLVYAVFDEVSKLHYVSMVAMALCLALTTVPNRRFYADVVISSSAQLSSSF